MYIKNSMKILLILFIYTNSSIYSSEFDLTLKYISKQSVNDNLIGISERLKTRLRWYNTDKNLFY